MSGKESEKRKRGGRSRRRGGQQKEPKNEVVEPSARVPNSRVFIGNLVSEKVSREQLKEIFGKYGEITETPVIRKSYAFVQFANPEAADKAIKAEKGRKLEGLKLDVMLADNRDPKRKEKEEQKSGSRGGRGDKGKSRKSSGANAMPVGSHAMARQGDDTGRRGGWPDRPAGYERDGPRYDGRGPYGGGYGGYHYGSVTGKRERSPSPVSPPRSPKRQMRDYGRERGEMGLGRPLACRIAVLDGVSPHYVNTVSGSVGRVVGTRLEIVDVLRRDLTDMFISGDRQGLMSTIIIEPYHEQQQLVTLRTFAAHRGPEMMESIPIHQCCRQVEQMDEQAKGMPGFGDDRGRPSWDGAALGASFNGARPTLPGGQGQPGRVNPMLAQMQQGMGVPPPNGTPHGMGMGPGGNPQGTPATMPPQQSAATVGSLPMSVVNSLLAPAILSGPSAGAASGFAAPPQVGPDAANMLAEIMKGLQQQQRQQ